MARKRMIDPNIWESEDFSHLSILARILFIGMFSNADDEGRGRAKPVYLKSIIFPYDEGIRVADIEKALSEIGSKMSVALYSHDGNDYYALTNWKKWQKVDKPQKSLLPEPFGDDSANDRGTFGDEFPNDRGTFPPNRIEEKRSEKKGIEENRMPGAETPPDRKAIPFLTMPLNDGTEYGVEEGMMEEWKGLDPAVDVEQELRNMKGWLLSNPARRKTKSGIQRFITNWLSREQNRGGKSVHSSTPSSGRNYDEAFYDGIMKESVEELKTVPKEKTQKKEEVSFTEKTILENYKKYINPGLSSFEEEWLMQKVRQYGEEKALSAMRAMIRARETETGDFSRRLEGKE